MARPQPSPGRGRDEGRCSRTRRTTRGWALEADRKERPRGADPGAFEVKLIGTAYRIRTGDLRLERAVSWASRRMRQEGDVAVRPVAEDTRGARMPAIEHRLAEHAPTR